MAQSGTPRDDLRRLLEQVNHSIEETALAIERGEPLEALGAPFQSWQEGYTWMPLDMLERDDEYVVMADLPGLEKGEIDVRVRDTALVIDAEHEEEETAEEEARFLRHERRQRGLCRTVQLPAGVDTSDISASMNNGVLTVHLPKETEEMEETEAVRIAISE
jgi:HSP20 family protein